MARRFKTLKKSKKKKYFYELMIDLFFSSTMIESIVTKYKEAIDEWNSLIAAHDDVPNDDEIFNIESSLKKIEIFYSCHDLGLSSLFLYLVNVICSFMFPSFLAHFSSDV